MKQIKSLLVFVLCLLAIATNAQENRFTSKLDKYCKQLIQSYRAVPEERKQVLDLMANDLVDKRYIVFTCKTNSRRTVLLQVWAQTGFYYYGLADRNAFSIGDTVTPVYSGVANVLSEVGFYVSRLANADPNGYMISISKDFPESIVSSKAMLGTIDTTLGIVVNICDEKEPSGNAAKYSTVHLPYSSPTPFEKTVREKLKYKQLNHRIALEMLYLSYRIKELLKEAKQHQY